nr:MAG TPA: hypothetical protein [Caudoviricetes sp.]
MCTYIRKKHKRATNQKIILKCNQKMLTSKTLCGIIKAQRQRNTNKAP